MPQRPKATRKAHSFRPLLFAPPQGDDALPKTLRMSEIKAKALPRSEPYLAKENESHVRLAAAPLADLDHDGAEEMLDELCEEQLALSIGLATLDGTLAHIPNDASARSAFATLQGRIHDLVALRDALAQVQISAVDRRFYPLFYPDAPLADYLRGVYAWTNAVTRSLDHLAQSLRQRAPAPDWALLRWRIEEASNFHFDELAAPIRRHIQRLASVPNAAQLAGSLENLFDAACRLEQHLDERFG